MRLLSEMNARPKGAPIQITHTRRKAVIDEIGSVIILYDETLRLEVTLPSVIQGLQNKLARYKTVLAQAFSSPFHGWCYVA